MTVGTAYDVDDLDHPELDQRRRWPFVLLGILLVLLVAGGLVATWVEHQINPSGPLGPEVQVTVRPGTSTGGVAHLLVQKGVISNATVFTYYARLRGTNAIKAGDYTFHRRQHMAQILDILERGGTTPTDRITIPEGLNLQEIAARVGALPGRSAERFLALAREGAVRSQFEPPGTNNLEGLLQPDTYFVARKDDEASILRRMVTAFDDTANQLDLAGGAARVGVTPYQVVVIASMIEREAKVAEDRGPIARVIYNRLAKRMTLGIDATVEYAIGRHTEHLTQSELDTNSPYNTRKFPGLPPGPIASAGRPSLQAALNPPPGPWLYYVLVDPSGKHAFATTPQEFEAAKAQARARGVG